MTINNDRTLRAILEKVELLTGERSDGSRRAVLISELNGLIQDLSDQSAVVKKSITALESQMGASSASLTQELMTLASNNTALAQAITTLKASISGNLAEIQDTKRAIALTDMALAEQLQTLSSKIGGNTAQIVEEKRTRVTQDEALAQSITSLSATVTSNNNTLTSAIQTEQTARANGDAANASSITSLTSTVIGHTSSITSLQSTTANISGALSATWAMTMVLDSATGGMKLTGVKKADGSGATFNLVIDSNVTINGNLLVQGTVTTGKISDNAVTSSGFASGTGTSSSPQSVTVTVRAGARVQILGTFGVSAGTTVSSWTTYNGAPDDPSPPVKSAGNLSIVTPSGTTNYPIVGYYKGTHNDVQTGGYVSDGTSVVFYDRYYDWQFFGATGVLFYRNTTSSDQTITFSAYSAASGANTTISVTELAR